MSERNIVFIALFAALIAALGLIPALKLPFGVPVTAQSLGVMLCGTILGGKRGALAALLFVVLVAVGLPLLSGGRGGLGVFVSPSVGFLVGFPVAAWVTGTVVERWRSMHIGVAALLGSLLGSIVLLYIMGITGMSIVLDKSFYESLLLVGWFIPGDIVKAFIASAITVGLWNTRPNSVLSRSTLS